MVNNIIDSIFDWSAVVFTLGVPVYLIITATSLIHKYIDRPKSTHKYTVIRRIAFPNGDIHEGVYMRSNEYKEVALFDSGENNFISHGVKYTYSVIKNRKKNG